MLNEFTDAKELSDAMSQVLAAIQQALSGLSKVDPRIDELRDVAVSGW